MGAICTSMADSSGKAGAHWVDGARSAAAPWCSTRRRWPPSALPHNRSADYTTKPSH